VVGGTYDKAPWVYPDVVEKEYAKLEPYINIYSLRAVELGLSEKDRYVLNRVLEAVEQGKIRIEGLEVKSLS